MKLHAVNWKGAMPQSHDFLFRSLGSNFKTVWKRLAFHEQRMVSRRFKGIRQAHKNAFAIMKNGRSLSVHQQPRAHHIAAENVSHALMPEAHAEDRSFFTEC